MLCTSSEYLLIKSRIFNENGIFVHCTDCGMYFTILNYSVLIYSSFVHAIVCYYIY